MTEIPGKGFDPDADPAIVRLHQKTVIAKALGPEATERTMEALEVHAPLKPAEVDASQPPAENSIDPDQI